MSIVSIKTELEKELLIDLQEKQQADLCLDGSIKSNFMKRLIFVFGIFASFVFAQDPNQKFVDQFSVHLQCDKYEKRLFGLAGEKLITSNVAIGLIENSEKEYRWDVLQKYSIAVLHDVENPGGIEKDLNLTIDAITSYQVNLNRKSLSGTFAGRNLKCRKISKKEHLRILNIILDEYYAKYEDNKI